jgi:transposase
MYRHLGCETDRADQGRRLDFELQSRAASMAPRQWNQNSAIKAAVSRRLELPPNVVQRFLAVRGHHIVRKPRYIHDRTFPPCVVGIEACGTAHFWAREIARCGHDVRLMPPSYVKPYVKRNKHDAADAEAVCEAVRRPSTRFVPVKTAEQQAALVARSVRDLLVRQRTMLANALRGHLAEFGIVAPRGIQKVDELAAVVADESDGRIPASARNALRILVADLAALDLRITRLETEIVAREKTDAVARRLATIPGIGPIIASRLSAMVPDPSIFRSARDFAAWIGLVPRQSSTGGKPRLGGISKRGNGSLRRLLVGGAMAAMFRSKALQNDAWLSQLRARKPVMVAAVALANEIARAVWAVMRRNAVWRPAVARSSSRPHQPGAVLTAIKTMPPAAVAFGQS